MKLIQNNSLQTSELSVTQLTQPDHLDQTDKVQSEEVEEIPLTQMDPQVILNSQESQEEIFKEVMRIMAQLPYTDTELEFYIPTTQTMMNLFPNLNYSIIPDPLLQNKKQFKKLKQCLLDKKSFTTLWTLENIQNILGLYKKFGN